MHAYYLVKSLHQIDIYIASSNRLLTPSQSPPQPSKSHIQHHSSKQTKTMPTKVVPRKSSIVITVLIITTAIPIYRVLSLHGLPLMTWDGIATVRNGLLLTTLLVVECVCISTYLSIYIHMSPLHSAQVYHAFRDNNKHIYDSCCSFACID